MTDLPPTSDTTTISAILMHNCNGNPSAAQGTSLSTVPLQLDEASLRAPTSGAAPAFLISTTAANNHKRKRRPAGTPDPDAEVVALSPTTLMESDRYVCDICNQGFQRDQNLQMHRRRHRVPWKLAKRLASPDQVRKRVYVCPEPTCLHHDASHALGDLIGIKKHYRRKHNCMKQWECEKCCKAYAVQSDYKAHLKTCGTRGHCCDCGRVFSRVESFIEHQDSCAARGMAAVAAAYAAASLPSLNDTQKSISPTPSVDTVNDYHHHVIMNARSLAAGRDGAAPSPRRSTAGAARFIHESPPPLPNSPAGPSLPAAPPPPPPTAAPAGRSWAAQQLMSISEGEHRGAELQLLPTKHSLHIKSSQSSVTLGKDMMAVISSAACSPSKTEERTAKSSQKNSAPPKLQLSIGLCAQETSCDTSIPSMSRPSEGKDSCLMPDSERKAWLEWRPMHCSLQFPALLTDDASVPILAMATPAKRCSIASANKHLAAVGCARTNLELATSTWVNPAPQRNGAELVSDQTKLCNGRGSTSEWKLVMDTSTSSSPRMLQEFQGTSMEVQQQQRPFRESAAAVEARCHEPQQSKIPGHMKLLLGRCKSAAELLMMQEAGEKLKRASTEKFQAERAWQEAKRERELAEAELESAHRVRENAYISQLLLLKAAAFHHASSSSPSSSSNSRASSYSQLHRYDNRLITCPTCHQQTSRIVHPAAYNKAAALFSDTGAGGYTESPPIITNKPPSANKSQRRYSLEMPSRYSGFG